MQIDKSRIKKVLDERIPESAFEAKAGGGNPGSNLITPTLQMIEDVIRAFLIDGKSPKQIKREVENWDGKSLSLGQIGQIIGEARAYRSERPAAKDEAKI